MSKWALVDRFTDQIISKMYDHKDQAWTEAYERKLVMQGRMGSRGEDIHLLNPNYEIKEVSDGPIT